MKNLIFFATKDEALETLIKLKASSIDKQRYLFKKGLIVIGGMGMLNTIITLMQIEKPIGNLLSLGCAGALKNQPLFSQHAISEVARLFPGGSEHAKQLFFKMYPTLNISSQQKKRILCSEVSMNSKMHQQGELVDMESYSIAQFALQNKIPLKMIRVISDFSDQNTAESIKKNLDKVSKTLAKIAIQEVSTFV